MSANNVAMERINDTLASRCIQIEVNMISRFSTTRNNSVDLHPRLTNAVNIFWV